MESPNDILLIETKTQVKFDDRYIKELTDKLRSQRFKKVIIDEYLSCRRTAFSRSGLMYLLKVVECEELVLFSTPDKRYTQEQLVLSSSVLNLQSHTKNDLINYNDIISLVETVRNSFLDLSDVKIIKIKECYLNNEAKIAEKSLRSEEEYKTQVLGELIK